MTTQMGSPRPRWLVRRLHPVSRYGYSMLVDGGKRSSNSEMGMGLAIIVAGMALRRRNRPPQRLYRTELGVGESLAIHVVENGEVVSETAIPGPDA